MEKGTVKIMNKTYNTYVFKTVEETNEFLKKNKNYGVIQSNENDTEIHVAKI